MNRKLLIGLVGILILVGGYALLSGSDKSGIQTSEEETMSPTEYTIVLSEENASGESGTAMLKEENGKTTVTISVTGYAKDVPQPAHIHIGACPGVGAVKYPLNNVLNGTSVTTLSVTLDQLRSEQPLGLNVHKSISEAQVYVSCGDLVL